MVIIAAPFCVWEDAKNVLQAALVPSKGAYIYRMLSAQFHDRCVYISLTDDFVLCTLPVDMVPCLDSSPVRMAVVSLSIHACLSLSLDAWKLS